MRIERIEQRLLIFVGEFDCHGHRVKDVDQRDHTADAHVVHGHGVEAACDPAGAGGDRGIGAVLGELSVGSDLLKSGRSGLGAWLGMVVATAAKLVITFLMIGLVIFKLGFAQRA